MKTRRGQHRSWCQVPVSLRSKSLIYVGTVVLFLPSRSDSFSPVPRHIAISRPTTSIFAKRNRKQQMRQDIDDLNRWYDAVKEDATPDDVFWEEMDRQRLLNQIGSDNAESQEFVVGQAARTARAVASTASSLQEFQNNIVNTPTALQQVEQQKAERTTESTLTEYERFMVHDNWIDENLVALFGGEGDFGDDDQLDRDEQDEMIAREMNDFEGYDEEALAEQHIKEFNDAWMTSAEPWDIWGQPREMQGDRALRVKSDPGNEFLLQGADAEENERTEKDFWMRMRNCRVWSKRLEKARGNPKAKEFFKREPDAIQGYDKMWVCAIDNASFQNLAGVFRNYGIQFADNFGDFEDGCIEDGLCKIEDIASFKARKVFEVTGLPVVTSRTSFDIEPIPASHPIGLRTSAGNPRVMSGYRFNNIGDHVDHMIYALKTVSEPKRKTRFRTCLCFYDGEIEFYEFSCLECDLYWASSMRTFITVNQAINQMCKTLQLTFGLEYMKWLKNSQAEANLRFSSAVTQLRDRVLKDGRVLPNDIIDVSAFMDSMVDVDLMDDCAKDLAERFVDLKPTKILTVATTGLVIALPMAKYLQVPVVYARKERNVVMAETYKASYSSKTVGKGRELLVSKSHLDEEDRVLIVDDFLSSGASQEALLRIVSDAGAEAVGVGVLLEKVYDSGRRSLSGFNVPVQSLCRVASVKGGVIQLQEEEGFNLMN